MIEPVFSKPPPGGDHEPPPKAKRFWLKFSVAAVLIVSVSAAATATSILLYIGSIAHALSHNNVYKDKLDKQLANVNGGGPETILILGSDKRANLKEDPGRSDTTMLLRLDPEQDAIAVLSIPRDLKVEIPGWGTEKFNAAYTYGGAKLTLRVVKELTGLEINHVVNVDFLGFVRAVDAIQCVYVDVDRRYYHNNAESVRRICRNQRPAGLPAALREKGPAVRALPAHRHGSGPLGPPAGLHQRGPGPGAGRRPPARPQRTDRHLHQVHDLRHQRHLDDDPDA